MDAGERDSGLRLTELIAAFSLASDLGLGQPMEHVLRSWAIAARLGEHVGVRPEERRALYYVATLAWSGAWPTRQRSPPGSVTTSRSAPTAIRWTSRGYPCWASCFAMWGQATPPSDGFALPPIVTLRRAALLHDIGLHAVPATILDKDGALSDAESERMRMHTYFTERMLARPPELARIGAIAAMAQERCDGSGHHRGLAGPAIPATGRLLAAGCAYRTLTEPRGQRPPMSTKQAVAELRAEVRAGRLDAGGVDAVIAAAGQGHGKRRAGPAGLTPREIEVLHLIARGASTKRVAQRLEISSKTAETHIERIYAKTGASTRSTVTLFAMKNGLLDNFEPLDS